MSELFMFYRKVASRTGWSFVFLNFIILSNILDTIKEASEKFSVFYLYQVWISHPHLAVSISSLITMSEDYQQRKGKNYQNVLRKIFGSLS